MDNEFDMTAGVESLSAGLFPDAESLTPEESLIEENPGEEETLIEGEEVPPEEENPAEENPSSDKPAETKEEKDPTAIAPKTWRKDAAAEWDKLSPTVKAEIAKREEDMFKGIENYKLDATIGQNFKNTVIPHIDYLQKAGVDPYQEIGGLLEYSKTMRFGTKGERMQLLGNIAHEYGIDLLDLAAEVPAPAYIDPQVKHLQDQLNALQSSRQQEDTYRQSLAVQDAQAKITAFSSNPKNEHFATVEQEMAAFISSGVCKTLDEAYEKAVWANPLTRAKEQTRQAAETLAQSQAKVAEAKRATAANVKTNARPGSATAPNGSIDDTLAETLANIRSR